MTLYPPRIQLKTLLTGVILTRKLTFRKAKCFAKVTHIIETGVQNIQISVRIIPCPPKLQLQQTLWGHLDKENDI